MKHFIPWILLGAFTLLGTGIEAAGPPDKQDPKNVRCCKMGKCETCCLSELAPQSKEKGKGPGFQGRGPGAADQKADMEVFHYLLDHRKEITRKVKDLPNGVETLTESSNKEVATKIQEHAEAMHKRVKEGRPIHMRDPLFREIFRHAHKIEMKVERTTNGVRVKETSSDAFVVQLIQAHAKVVSNFLTHGYEEVRKNHEVPRKR